MKTFLITIVLFFAGAAYGQTCPAGSQCVPQSVIDKCGEVADKLRAANEVIEKFQAERGASVSERAAATALIDGLNQLLKTKDSIIADYERINALYTKVIEFQTQIIDNLEKRLNKPRSAFQKFMKALTEIGLILAGIAIGHAGI